MNSDNKLFSCEEANNQDMVDYLSRIGFEPKRISGYQYWYLSPFRNERTASFKINRNINCWYDFGEGKGGTMVDFGIRYFECSVFEFLQKLQLSSSAKSLSINNSIKTAETESSIRIVDVKTITSLSLRNYLKERKVDMDTALTFCKEVSFQINDKNYFAIGFANDAGGYELRNSFFKGSTKPKGITSIVNNGTKLNFFEGFFDFLSYRTIMQKPECVNDDYCILNSLSFIDKAKQLLNYYEAANIFFDRDKSGIKATRELQEVNTQAINQSHLYKNCKDLNEWLVQFGLSTKLSSKRDTEQ